MGDPLLYTYANVETVTPKWDSIIRDSGTDIVLYDVKTPLADVMDHAADWTKVYQDGLSVAFVPTDKVSTLAPPRGARSGRRGASAPSSPRRPRTRERRTSETPGPARDREHRAANAGPTASRIAWIGAAAIVVLVLTVQPFSDTDVWWHLALGRLITTSGIPAHEPFSFLPAAHAWVGQQWLYEVTLAGLVGAGGAALASLVMGLAAVAAVVLAALAIPRSARVTGPWLALAMVITGLVLNSVVGVSSSVISVLGVAVVLFVISRWREGRTAAVWGLPPLFLLWANMDAGFAAGLVIVLAALLLLPAHSGGSQREPASTRHRARCQRCRGARQPCRARHLRLGALRGLQSRRRPEPRRRTVPRTSTSGGRASSKARWCSSSCSGRSRGDPIDSARSPDSDCSSQHSSPRRTSGSSPSSWRRSLRCMDRERGPCMWRRASRGIRGRQRAGFTPSRPARWCSPWPRRWR